MKLNKIFKELKTDHRKIVYTSGECFSSEVKKWPHKDSIHFWERVKNNGKTLKQWNSGQLPWLMLELCCDISGDKMAAKMAILAIKSAKMSQDGAQEVAKLS